MQTTSTASLIVAAGVLAAVAACGGDEPQASQPGPEVAPAATSPASPTTSAATTAPATTTSDRPAPTRCNSARGDADDQPLDVAADIDGDGRDDPVSSLSPDRTRTFQLEVQASALGLLTIDTGTSQLGFSVLPVDADGDGDDELMVTTPTGDLTGVGSYGIVYVAKGCRFVPVVDRAGKTYRFQVLGQVSEEQQDRAVRHGVGCLDVDRDGQTELTGTRATYSAGRGAWSVKRTPVRVHDGVATNLKGDEVVVDGTSGETAAVRSLGTATCGDVRAESVSD